MYSLYREQTLVEDKEMVQAWNNDLDSMLLFVRARTFHWVYYYV